MKPIPRTRRGFVLVAVLWIVMGLSAIAMTVAVLARESVSTAQNRLALTRAEWGARDCLARVQVAIATALSASDADPTRPSAWINLPTIIQTSPVVQAIPCQIWVRARRQASVADSEGVIAPDTVFDTTMLSILLTPGAPELGGWVLTIGRTEGTAPVVTAFLEEHSVLTGDRVAIVRQRTWP